MQMMISQRVSSVIVRGQGDNIPVFIFLLFFYFNFILFLNFT